jgi:hypothetical protein
LPFPFFLCAGGTIAGGAESPHRPRGGGWSLSKNNGCARTTLIYQTYSDQALKIVLFHCGSGTIMFQASPGEHLQHPPSRGAAGNESQENGLGLMNRLSFEFRSC